MLLVQKDCEKALYDMAVALKYKNQGHYVLHFNLSQLRHDSSSESHVAQAFEILNQHFGDEEGGIFISKNQDVIMIYKGENKSLLEKIIFQIRSLFSKDPLAFLDDKVENPRFCTVYLLDFQYQDFLQMCHSNLLTGGGLNIKHGSNAKDQTTLDAKNVFEVENKLFSIDLSNLMRSQPVCAFISGEEVRPIFHELYVSLTHLRELTNCPINLTSNKILFHYLTEKLDSRVLTLLKNRIARYTNHSVSLNLNINSVFSREFDEFDAIVQSTKKASSIIIEMNIADVFSDIVIFRNAMHELQRKQYRVCLDGLTNLSFIQIDRESLGFDLAKIQWNPSTKDILDGKEKRKLAESIKTCGSNRVVLCRCDDQDAVDYGHSLGISLFQGWHFDKMLNTVAKK